MWLSQVETWSPKQTLVSRKQAKRDPGARPRLDLTQSQRREDRARSRCAATLTPAHAAARSGSSTSTKIHRARDRHASPKSHPPRGVGRSLAFAPSTRLVPLTAFPILFSNALFAHCCGCVCCVLSAGLLQENGKVVCQPPDSI